MMKARCCKGDMRVERKTQKRTCSACGSPLKEGAVFCSACGAREGESRRRCPSCGEPAEANALFCGQCGTPFPVQETRDSTGGKKSPVPLVMQASVAQAPSASGAGQGSGAASVHVTGQSAYPGTGYSEADIPNVANTSAQAASHLPQGAATAGGAALKSGGLGLGAKLAIGLVSLAVVGGAGGALSAFVSQKAASHESVSPGLVDKRAAMTGSGQPVSQKAAEAGKQVAQESALTGRDLNSPREAGDTSAHIIPIVDPSKPAVTLPNSRGLVPVIKSYTEYEYDDYRKSQVPTQVIKHTFEYDDRYRLIACGDDQGMRSETREYDEQGRLHKVFSKGISSLDGTRYEGCSEYVYDEAGRLVLVKGCALNSRTETNDKEIGTYYSYDGQGRLTATGFYEKRGNGPASRQPSIRFAYGDGKFPVRMYYSDMANYENGVNVAWEEGKPLSFDRYGRQLIRPYRGMGFPKVEYGVAGSITAPGSLGMDREGRIVGAHVSDGGDEAFHDPTRGVIADMKYDEYGNLISYRGRVSNWDQWQSKYEFEYEMVPFEKVHDGYQLAIELVFDAGGGTGTYYASLVPRPAPGPTPLLLTYDNGIIWSQSYTDNYLQRY